MNMRSLILLALALTGCHAYRLEPPIGFAEVEHHDHRARMKAGDNVGLNVTVFDNVRGGTLAFWGSDLVRKLQARGYTLQAHTAVRSKNGTSGTRFDFDYVDREAQPKFYSVLLFVSDRHRVVVELAGNEALAEVHRGQIPKITEELVVRGCKPSSEVCRGVQPTRVPEPAPKADAPAPKADASAPSTPFSADQGASEPAPDVPPSAS